MYTHPAPSPTQRVDLMVVDESLLQTTKFPTVIGYSDGKA
jgi:hypothetical protein